MPTKKSEICTRCGQTAVYREMGIKKGTRYLGTYNRTIYRKICIKCGKTSLECDCI